MRAGLICSNSCIGGADVVDQDAGSWREAGRVRVMNDPSREREGERERIRWAVSQLG